jgi:hypothetical protein
MLAFLFWPREREPEYKGWPLSKWLEDYNSGHSREFVNAIDHFGTNAVPLLIRSIQYEPPRWRTWLIGTARKWPARASNSRFGEWLFNDRKEQQAVGAIMAFGILGQRAEPALNELGILVHSKSSKIASRANWCVLSVKAGLQPTDLHVF